MKSITMQDLVRTYKTRFSRYRTSPTSKLPESLSNDIKDVLDFFTFSHTWIRIRAVDKRFKE